MNDWGCYPLPVLSVLQPSPASVQQQQPLSDRGWAWSRASGGQPPLSWPLIGQLWPDPGLWLAQWGPWSLMLGRLGRLVPLTHIVKARLSRLSLSSEPGPARTGETELSSWLRPDSPVQPVTAHPTHISKLELAKVPKIFKNKDVTWIKSRVRGWR